MRGGRTYPNHGSECIADDEEGESEESFDRRNVEMRFDALKAGSVDSGPNIDRSCQEANLESDENFLGSAPIPRVMRIVRGPGNKEVINSFFLAGCDRGPLICDQGFL